MLSTRNPFPYPQYEGDDDFCGERRTQQTTYDKPAHIAQKEDPWYRLSYKPTLSSLRKEVDYFDPQAPNDSLDFALKTEYNQHREFMKDKNETVLQKQTLAKHQHNGAMNNRTANNAITQGRVRSKSGGQSHGHPVRIVESARRNNPSSIKTAISSHHSQTTNVGYSRKPDGGFYAS